MRATGITGAAAALGLTVAMHCAWECVHAGERMGRRALRIEGPDWPHPVRRWLGGAMIDLGELVSRWGLTSEAAIERQARRWGIEIEDVLFPLVERATLSRRC